MVIIYTILSAVVGMALIVIIDMLITKIFDEKSILQKNYIKMPLSYFIGILVFKIKGMLIFVVADIWNCYNMVLAPGENRHSGPGENRQFWPDENRQSLFTI